MKTLREDIIKRLDQPYFFKGYAYGFKTPCLRYKVKISFKDNFSGSSIDEFLQTKINYLDKVDFDEIGHESINILKTWVGIILKNSGHPVFESPRQLSHKSISENEAMIV